MYRYVDSYFNYFQFYNNSGSNQGMVTIKRVLLPNSEEHGVTITPKGSDHLIYTSQDHSMGMYFYFR